MTRLIMLCGLPATGKTSLASELAPRHHALILSPDEWLEALGASQADSILRKKVEALQWRIAQQALTAGINVILDWRFWSRSERKAYKTEAQALGVDVEVRFLEASREELLARIEKRNGTLAPGQYRISAEDLDAWALAYEPPTDDELL